MTSQAYRILALAFPLLAATLLLTRPSLAATGSLITLLMWSQAAAGMWRRRTWGLFLLLAGVPPLVLSGTPGPASLALGLTAVLVFALHLPRLLRTDALVALLLTAVSCTPGWIASRLLTPSPSVPAVASVRPAGEPVRPLRIQTSRTRQLHVAVAPIRGTDAIRVTFTNTSEEPLDLDLPLDNKYGPLLDPLLRVEVQDLQGRALKHVSDFGCGMVYAMSKVEARVLQPGEGISRTVRIPQRYYPAAAVLPSYSHAMMINEDAVRRAPPPPPPARRVRLRVVYSTAAVPAVGWRDDLVATGRTLPTQVAGGSRFVEYTPRSDAGAAAVRAARVGPTGTCRGCTQPGH